MPVQAADEDGIFNLSELDIGTDPAVSERLQQEDDLEYLLVGQ